jgi:toluene monooxygenase system ferredoxin subunit
VNAENGIPLDELWIGEMKAVSAGGRRVLLLRLEEGVFAYEDRCAHLGVPLSEGTLEGSVLTCRAHHYCYDARTGAGINPKNVCLVGVPLAVRAERIWLGDSARSGEKS